MYYFLLIVCIFLPLFLFMFSGATELFIAYILILGISYLIVRMVINKLKNPEDKKIQIKDLTHQKPLRIVIKPLQFYLILLVAILLIFGPILLIVLSYEKEEIKLLNSCTEDFTAIKTQNVCNSQCKKICRTNLYPASSSDYQYKKDGCGSCSCLCSRFAYYEISRKLQFGNPKLNENLISNISFEYLTLNNSPYVNLTWEENSKKPLILRQSYSPVLNHCTTNECNKKYSLINVTSEIRYGFLGSFEFFSQTKKRYTSGEYAIPLNYTFFGMNIPPHPRIEVEIDGNLFTEYDIGNTIFLKNNSFDSIKLISNSYDEDGSINKTRWTMSNKIISQSEIATIKKVDTPGEIIALTITDDKGGTSTKKTHLLIYERKIANPFDNIKIRLGGYLLAALSFFIGLAYLRKFLEMKKMLSSESTLWRKPLLKAIIWGFMLPFMIILITHKILRTYATDPLPIIEGALISSPIQTNNPLLPILIITSLFFGALILFFIYRFIKYEQNHGHPHPLRELINKLFSRKKK